VTENTGIHFFSVGGSEQAAGPDEETGGLPSSPILTVFLDSSVRVVEAAPFPARGVKSHAVLGESTARLNRDGPRGFHAFGQYPQNFRKFCRGDGSDGLAHFIRDPLIHSHINLAQ